MTMADRINLQMNELKFKVDRLDDVYHKLRILFHDEKYTINHPLYRELKYIFNSEITNHPRSLEHDHRPSRHTHNPLLRAVSTSGGKRRTKKRTIKI